MVGQLFSRYVEVVETSCFVIITFLEPENCKSVSPNFVVFIGVFLLIDCTVGNRICFLVKIIQFNSFAQKIILSLEMLIIIYTNISNITVE